MPCPPNRSRRPSTWLATSLATASMVLFPVLATPVRAQADRPPISEAVRELIAEKGADGAQRELVTLLAAGRDAYEMDGPGLVALGREYLEAEAFDSALFTLNLAVAMTPSAEVQVALADVHVARGQPEMAALFYRQALAEDPSHARARERLAAMGQAVPDAGAADARERRAASRSEDGLTDGQRAERQLANREGRGESRDDIERFKGRYADPNRAQRHHVFWVAETCRGSGYLMAGAEWGDVAPWVMRGESENRFVQWRPNPGQDPLTFEFRLGSDGVPTHVAIEGLGAMDTSSLERLGDLREGWQPEGDRCRLDRPGGGPLR